MHLADIIVTNLHKRYTGVSATVQHLIPLQQQELDVMVLDTGNLDLTNKISLWKIITLGWRKPKQGKYRVWHARRDVSMLLGLFLKNVLRQPWKLVFTSAYTKSKRPGGALMWLMNRMDAIISTSKRVATFLDWHSTIIHHGVDLNQFKPPKTKPKELTIGVFGRLRPSKGTDLVITAMIALLPTFPNWRIVFAGIAKDKDFLKKLEQKINSAGLQDRITFLGQVEQEKIPALYQQCSLVIAASRLEGFGLTPLEAMATGVPVVTSEAGFWPELVKPGKNGQLFKTGDVNSLTQTLKPLLANPNQLQTMGDYARQDVVGHHSIAIEAAKINQFYLQLINAS